MDAAAYDRAVQSAHGEFLRQSNVFLNLFSSLLPFSSRRRPNRD